MTAIVPGIKGKHVIICPLCRKNKGIRDAFVEAVETLSEEYQAICNARKDRFQIHLVLTVEEIKGDLNT